MDFAEAKLKMVNQQLRTNNVLTKQYLDLMCDIPRERFLKLGYEKLAYADTMVPIGEHQVSLTPKIIGQILEATKIQPENDVLEIGTGTGYLTALMAKLAKHVTSIEIITKLSQTAQSNLQALEINNVSLEIGDGSRGWNLLDPQDVIVITGSIPILPQSFKQLLKVGGRLFAFVGEAPAMRAILITRSTLGNINMRTLFETQVPVLKNAPELETFKF